MFTEHWEYLAVNAACKLNLFDALEKPKTAKELADELDLNEDALRRLLSALCSNEYLKINNDIYSLTEKSNLLTENNPETLKYACMNWAEEHLLAWQDLDYTIKTGKSSFEHIFHSSFFDYLDKQQKKLHNYHKAMYEYARDDYKTLPNKVDFSKYKSIMDVGGGYGAAIKTIEEKFPQTNYYLLDLPKVVKNLNLSNIKVIGGNFFETIPPVAEVILLSRVLHDWNDEKADLILKNCYKSLPKSGFLYIIENCVDKINIDLSLLSLNMTAMCKSYERTVSEYTTLCAQQGFEYQQDIKLNQLQTILIFTKL